MSDHYKLATALVEEAVGHLIGRTDIDAVAAAFGVSLRVVTGDRVCGIKAHGPAGDLLAAVTASIRGAGQVTAAIDVFRVGGLLFWAAKTEGRGVCFWGKGARHYYLTADVAADRWILSAADTDLPFYSLYAVAQHIGAIEAGTVWETPLDGVAA